MFRCLLVVSLAPVAILFVSYCVSEKRTPTATKENLVFVDGKQPFALLKIPNSMAFENVNQTAISSGVPRDWVTPALLTLEKSRTSENAYPAASISAISEDPVAALRWSCRALARDVVRFAAQYRLRLELGGASDGAWRDPNGKTRSECAIFAKDYSTQFAPKFAALREECAKQGLYNPVLDLLTMTPTDPPTVKALGQLLLCFDGEQKSSINSVLLFKQAAQPNSIRDDRFTLQL